MDYNSDWSRDVHVYRVLRALYAALYMQLHMAESVVFPVIRIIVLIRRHVELDLCIKILEKLLLCRVHVDAPALKWSQQRSHFIDRA